MEAEIFPLFGILKLLYKRSIFEDFALVFGRVYLVGGFNPSEKYQSNWIISPGRGETKKCLKRPPENGILNPFFEACRMPCILLVKSR